MSNHSNNRTGSPLGANLTVDVDKKVTPSKQERKFVRADPSLLEDAELAYDNLTNQELHLIKETENLFKQQVDYMILIDSLRDYIPDMERISSDTKRLATLVDSSYSLVEGVCSKFRRIDLSKVRLEDSLAKIGDILDLKTCRTGVLNALQSNNYEEAAMHIKRYLSIDQKELQKTISIIYNDYEYDVKNYRPERKMSRLLMNIDDETDASTAGFQMSDENLASSKPKQATLDSQFVNQALRELDQSRARLLHTCQENIARAIKENNTKDIERFFKIFPLINEHQSGLLRYSEYLRSKVLDQQLEAVLNSKDTNQADKLSALFESVAKLIDHHQPLIETFYGPGHLIVVVKVVQKECDTLSRRLLEEFRNETKLQSVAKLVRNSSMPIVTQSLTTTVVAQNSQMQQLNLQPSKLDPRAVDKILNEISLIVSRSEVYLSFIVQRIKDDIKSRAEDESKQKAYQLELYNMIFHECELNHLIQEVGGIYVMLEQFFLNESSKKAILMDQIDIDPSCSCLVSSMLDDIFFIIKKCTKRAVSTKSNEVFCAIINHCVTLLESTFCQLLESRLKNQQYYTSFSTKGLDFSQAYNAIQSGRYLQSTNDQEKSNAQYFSALNNLDKACDYMRTLRQLLDVDVQKLKPSILILESKQDSQLEKSLACLNELTHLITRFTSIINSTLYQLFNTSLRSRVKAELKIVLDENPDLFSIVTNNSKELTNLARSLLRTVDNFLEKSLLQENYSRLVSITNDFLATTLKTIK